MVIGDRTGRLDSSVLVASRLAFAAEITVVSRQSGTSVSSLQVSDFPSDQRRSSREIWTVHVNMPKKGKYASVDSAVGGPM